MALAGEHGLDDLVAVLEPSVHRGPADAAALRDLLHGAATDPAGHEQLGRGVEDPRRGVVVLCR